MHSLSLSVFRGLDRQKGSIWQKNTRHVERVTLFLQHPSTTRMNGICMTQFLQRRYFFLWYLYFFIAPPTCVWWLEFSFNIHQNCVEEGEGEEGSIRFGGAGHWHPIQVKIIRSWEGPESQISWEYNFFFFFRQHQMVGREGKGGHSFLAIDHIRDQLIPPQVRQ